MATRLFELSISVPCENGEAEDGMTRAVEDAARTLYAQAAMLAFQGKPRIRLTITSTAHGKMTRDIVADAAAEAEARHRT